MALRLWLGQARMRRLRASAVPAEPAAAALCREVARQMNVDSPTVWRSPFLFSPCLDGLRRPAILLPDDVDENLRETFIHELAHLVRRDGLWNLLRRSATAALWVQPLLWVLSRRLEATAEEVCDDYVVHWGAERAHYAGISSCWRVERFRRGPRERGHDLATLDAGAESRPHSRYVPVALDACRHSRCPGHAHLRPRRNRLRGPAGRRWRARPMLERSQLPTTAQRRARGQDDPWSGRHSRRQTQGRRDRDPGAMAADA